MIKVNKAPLTITWAHPADITYGTALSAAQLDATASVPGTFSYTPAAGTVLPAGTAQILSVAFTPTDSTDYGAVSDSVAINVNKATPTITWANPADITYGTALSAAQLDAAASVPGNLTYLSVSGAVLDAGTVLNAGASQILSVVLAPTDSTDYNSASASVRINVGKATPTVTWADPAGITYGTALSAAQLDAAPAWTVGGVNRTLTGNFTYSPAAGTVLNAGTGQTLSVTFTPYDSDDYTSTSDSVTINVDKATPTITWADPADITYGTALSAAQLDAASAWTVGGVKGTVAGSFTYTPAAGSILGAGLGQTLWVAFTPTDATDYASTSASVTINVDKATPTINWANPAGITYGTALSAAQLDATASVPGQLTYSPAAGTVLSAGAGQALSVVLAPTDSTDYNPASASVTINVAKATPSVTWANPSDITYGTALSATQLDATASVPGTFAYTPAAGTVLDAGPGQTLSAVFTPVDATDYNTASATATVTVLPGPQLPVSADLSVTVAGPATCLVEQNLVYTVTATNNGPSPATGVTVTDILPATTDATFVSTSTGATPDSTGTITFSPVSLTAGASISYVITLQPTVAAALDSPLVNTAKVKGDDFDPNPGNSTATTSTTVSPAVNLAITQFTAAAKTVQIGDDLIYTIVVVNNGPSPATAVTVTSPLESGTSYVAGSGMVAPAGSGTVGLQGSSVVASLGTLAPGASATMTFTVVPSAIGTLTGTASVKSNETDTNTSNNSASVAAAVVDRVGTIEFSTTGYTVPENADSATITVNRVNGARGTVTVNYKTVAINATPGLDFTPVSGTLTFPSGATSETIVVPVLDDPYDDRNELVSVVLSNVQTNETLGQPSLGSPSAATLTIQDIDPNFEPLTVTGVQWTGTARSITQILVTFSKPLIASTAINPANYALVNVGPDGKYGTSDDSSVALSATYQSSSLTVSLTPAQPLPANRFFHLAIESNTPGGVEDVGDHMLAGNGSTAGTGYAAMLASGTSLKYDTPAGEQVSLQIAGGGYLDDLLSGTGQGINLTVVGEIPHHTVLSGSVKKVRGGTGQAYLGYTISGLGKFGDVRVYMYSPPFRITIYPFSTGSSTSKGARPLIAFSPARSKASGIRPHGTFSL